MYSELYLDEAKKATWGKMTTAATGKTVYLPLIFFFNRNPGLYLPLIALQYHEVRIDIDLASDFNTYLDVHQPSRCGPTTCTWTPRSAAASPRRVTNTSSSRCSTLAPTPSPQVVSTKQVVCPTTTPSRSWCGASPTLPRQGHLVELLQRVHPHRRCSRVQRCLGRHRSLQLLCANRVGGCSLPHCTPPVPPPPDTSRRLLVPSTPSSWSSTVRTVSRSRRVSTSTRCSPSTTTPVTPPPVSTRTPSRSSPRSTSPLVLATSRASTTRRSGCACTPLAMPPTCTCSRPTTTFSASSQVWAVWLLATKH
jgi:hypothetical protein